MKFEKMSRRQFLQGAGGFTLALPLLPSLLSEAAQAQVPYVPSSLVMMWTTYGALADYNTKPNRSRLQGEQTQRIQDGFDMHYAELPSDICPVLGTSFDSIRNKMNLITGLDIPSYLGHQYHAMGGNFYSSEQTPGLAQVPTIDQVLAASSKVYSSEPAARSLVLNPATSHSISLRSDGASGVVQVPAIREPQALFDMIFESGGSSAPADTGVVDAVYEDYSSTVRHPRLSSGDKQRLNEHMDFIRDLQLRLGVARSCEDQARPDLVRLWPDPNEPKSRIAFQLFNDLIVAAFRCGLTRIVTVTHEYFTPFLLDWHDKSHAWYEQSNEDYVLSVMRWFAENVYLDLISKMNQVVNSDGSTLLDRSLVVWSDENRIPHNNYDCRLVCAGSAGDKLRTGHWFDYSNRSGAYTQGSDGYGAAFKPGLLYSQFLVTVLRAFGLEPADYERPRHGVFSYGGYGQVYPNNNWNWEDRFGVPQTAPQTLIDNHYPMHLADQPLPVFWL